MQPSYSLPQLRLLAQAWCDGTGKSVQILDTLLTDPTRRRDHRRFFTRLQKDPRAIVTSRTMELMTRFFLSYWPDGVEWPAEVPRLVLEDAA